MAVHKINDQDLALLVTLTRSELICTTAAWQAVPKAICMDPVLVFTQIAGLIEATSRENATETHACMTGKGIMVPYPDRFLYIIIFNCGKEDIHFS